MAEIEIVKLTFDLLSLLLPLAFTLVLWYGYVLGHDKSTDRMMLPVGFSLITLSQVFALLVYYIDDFTTDASVYFLIFGYIFLLLWVKPQELFKREQGTEE